MAVKRGYYHEGFDEVFIRKLDELRARDEASVASLLYQDELNKLFSEMMTAFNGRVRECLGDVDFSNMMPLQDVIRAYLSGESSGDVRINYIISRVSPICVALHVSEGLFGAAVLSTQYLLVTGYMKEARMCFAPALIPAVQIYRGRSGSRGRKGHSGRKPHPQRREAEALGWGFLMKNPKARPHKVAVHISDELFRIHGRGPTVRGVQNWLKDSGFRFDKKCGKVGKNNIFSK
jgi:hypothetical protein